MVMKAALPQSSVSAPVVPEPGAQRFEHLYCRENIPGGDLCQHVRVVRHKAVQVNLDSPSIGDLEEESRNCPSKYRIIKMRSSLGCCHREQPSRAGNSVGTTR